MPQAVPPVLIPHFEWEWLRSLPYEQYLQTTHWQRVRFEALERGGRRCAQCGATEKLDVHHLSYEHRGGEDVFMQDLQVLCRPCHAAVHGKVSQ